MSDDKAHTCVNCQLAAALSEWRDAGADVDDVIEAIRDLVQAMVVAELDEIFGEVDEEVRKDAH